MSAGDTSALRATRDRTQRHYDRYPFVFDQEGILEEKLHRRVMGRAILALQRFEGTPRVLDVGSGMCRVARMVREAVGARVVSVDISLATLHTARAENPDPLVNGDNTRLPLATGCADLVISNGVIMVTPDVRASFSELARIVKPGGTLVVSVYDRGWYYWVYTYAGAVVRALQRWIGDAGLRMTIFPLFHASIVVLMSLVTRKPFAIPSEVAWNLFHDQFTTPHCTFHTFDEVEGWAREEGLVCAEKALEAARQLVTLRLTKPAG